MERLYLLWIFCFVGFLYLSSINVPVPNLPELPSFLQSGIFEKKVIAKVDDKKDNDITNSYNGDGIHSNPPNFNSKETFGEEIITAMNNHEKVQNDDSYIQYLHFWSPLKLPQNLCLGR